MNHIQELKDYIDAGHDTSPDALQYAVKATVQYDVVVCVYAYSHDDAIETAVDLINDGDIELDEMSGFNITGCDVI